MARGVALGVNVGFAVCNSSVERGRRVAVGVGSELPHPPAVGGNAHINTRLSGPANGIRIFVKSSCIRHVASSMLTQSWMS